MSQGYEGPQQLSDSAIQSKMQDIPDWELMGNAIQSQRQFGDFVEAIAFVNRLVDPAEAARHHPDIAISYNTVTITLTTHDAGGLTEQDFALAAIISEID
ncbi:MAG: 4a-hydroxytetrahydrobiopterin dehydratase [Cyanobacteria bacterium P01_F01_bin.150]